MSPKTRNTRSLMGRVFVIILCVALLVTPALAALFAEPSPDSGQPSASVVTTSSATPVKALSASFESDAWSNPNQLHDMLAPFAALRSNAKVMAWNDAQTIAINQTASQQRRARARADADHEPADICWDAFGQLAAPIASAYRSGELPNLTAVLERVPARIPGAAVAKEFPDFSYQRPYQRLGLASQGGQIVDSHGGYAELASNNSFPSGHSYAGYLWGTTLATLVPELAPFVLARASEYAESRIVLGYHYPLDTIGSRIIATAVVARRWNDDDFRPHLLAASSELQGWLKGRCGSVALTSCTHPGVDPQSAAQTYRSSADYDAPTKADERAFIPTDAAALLTISHPRAKQVERQQLLESTALPGGHPLDGNPAEGGWRRLDLAAALVAR